MVLTWLVAFIIQGELRSWYFGTSWIVPLTPMTSAAYMVFTLYMIPDPATTPVNRRSGRIPIPKEYETELQSVITALGDMKQPAAAVKWERCETQGVGVLVSDTH